MNSSNGKTCLLDVNGFIPSSYSANEKTTSSIASVSTILAKNWALELQQARRLYITTCITRATVEIGWCLPTQGAQPIAGLALFETTVYLLSTQQIYSTNWDDVMVYILTLNCDLNPSMQTVVDDINTDGSVRKVTSNPQRTTISQNRTYKNDLVDTEFIIMFTPLGKRHLPYLLFRISLLLYQGNSYCMPLIEVISDLQVPGWSQGKHSGYPVSPGWNCGHYIDNEMNLLSCKL
ncbi:hypothetical protein THRCLA_20487 [Thraustotheca clavata]|uniref:Uncharacterized protein n=1 Tax=Thraustotheca clavata TaxID=74557 RepID=A0A1W0A7D6_9STRA|nr:hypothetical protein THRCLA_20487 [Thraustotheca clavata]